MWSCANLMLQSAQNVAFIFGWCVENLEICKLCVANFQIETYNKHIKRELKSS